MDTDQVRSIFGLLINVGFAIVMVLMLVGMFRGLGQQDQVQKIKKSSAKKMKASAEKVTFDDVAGLDEVLDDMRLLVDCLKHRELLADFGGDLPKGVLLVGPPGTGKTLLAKAVAGEAGVPFFSIAASEFVEMFVGVGAARVRDTFKQAKENAPSILFIDEADAVAQHRGSGIGNNNDEREQTLNQLLTEMDGFEKTVGVIVIAATNRPDKLDPAFLRRFERQFVVSAPDRAGRLELMALYSRDLNLADDVNLDTLAGDTAGRTGSDIASMFKKQAPVNALKRYLETQKRLAAQGADASTSAVETGYQSEELKKQITMEDLAKAVWDVQAGVATEAKSRRLSEAVKRLLAFHEGGHALVGHYLSTKNVGWSSMWGDPISKCTIIGAGTAGGYTAFATTDENNFPTKERLLGSITSALAANTAEQLFLGTTTTGCQNDLDNAYSLAKTMVTQVGMSALGPISVGAQGSDPFLGKAMGTAQGYGLGEKSSNQIDEQIKMILDDCRARATRILTDPVLRVFLEQVLVPELIVRETIQAKEFAALWQEHCLEAGADLLYSPEA